MFTNQNTQNQVNIFRQPQNRQQQSRGDVARAHKNINYQFGAPKKFTVSPEKININQSNNFGNMNQQQMTNSFSYVQPQSQQQQTNINTTFNTGMIAMGRNTTNQTPLPENVFHQASNLQNGGNFNPTTNPMSGYLSNQNILAVDTKMYENMTKEQQKNTIVNFNPELIKKLMTHYLKNLAISNKQICKLPYENPLRDQKIAKVASALKIKPQLIHLRKSIRENLTQKIAKLKQDKEKLHSSSKDFSLKIFNKLQIFKEQLIISVSHTKMVQEYRNEVDQITQEIEDFFKPLFDAHQNKVSFIFVDPNDFCLRLSQKLLRNIDQLSLQLDEMISCEVDTDQQYIDKGEVILQLVQYYQKVVGALHQYSINYKVLKRKALQISNQHYPESTYKKITEKANEKVKKDRQAYELIKEIESLMQNRKIILKCKKE